MSSLSSRSHLSSLGDSQAGQVSESSHQGAGQRWQRLTWYSAEAAGQSHMMGGREYDSVYIGFLLTEKQKWES